MTLLVKGRNGIFYESEECRELYEGASLRLEMSVMDISRFVWKELLMPKSERVREAFPEFAEVPGPNAEVDDLGKCWARMASDDRACETIMMQKLTNAQVLTVMALQLDWLRFAAARWPTADGRKAFNALVELQQVAISSLAAKGREQPGTETVVEALEAMLAPTA
jgi:hypothetical protein